jgi:PadR family transcriptional regulator, regulatory protein PadR
MAGWRMTVGVLAVLGAPLDRSDTELYGLEIVRASGLEPGTIYPILQRLRGAGWVSDRWEDPESGRTAGRPLRRYYRLTLEGRARAARALRRGRDRSGLSRLLASPRFPAAPPPRQARHERSQSTRLRGQPNPWRHRPQRAAGNGRRLSGPRLDPVHFAGCAATAGRCRSWSGPAGLPRFVA